MNEQARLFLYAADIIKIKGCCDRSARRIMEAIKKKYNRPRMYGVTLQDFCDYYDLPEQRVRALLSR